MPRSRYMASVTLEYDTLPPTLDRVEVAATAAHTAIARPAREAQRRHRGTRWSSLVVVLERAAARKES